MAASQPNIGNWYRLSGGELFEVVAVDDDDGTIDIQYFDGTVEEMDREDWEAQWQDGALEAAAAPEDWTGSVDVEGGDDDGPGSDNHNNDPTLRAGALDGIDLFEFD
jgi:hypothetical protein